MITVKMRRNNKHHVVWNRVQTDLSGKQAADRKTVDAQMIGQDHRFTSHDTSRQYVLKLANFSDS